jgi:Tol biopolymer transport system component/serine/threonine protein kinase/Flp pilus assembly protein TadD
MEHGESLALSRVGKMTPERWQRIKALLESAIERDPPAREAFLDEACAGDPVLRREVGALLDSHARAGDFIESPAYAVMATSLAESDLGPGTAIGPYEIVTRLAAGGMGDIYLAEDTRLGRKIVLKALPTAFTKDAERVRRFQLEARAASALNHPNIVTVYEIGQVDHLHYIAIEFIDGETLRQRLANGPPGIAEALEIAINVATALLAAHEAGLVQRDIKPENIMVRADRVVKVLDFGIAKLTESKPMISEASTLFQTQQGIIIGTAPYMSPEQARAVAVDARTDIWSLGAVLYEMVGGRPAFVGPTASDVIAAILSREPVPLVRYRPEVPTELEWIIKKALRKDRDERYQTIREFLADLKNLRQRLEFEEELKRSRDTSEVWPVTLTNRDSPSWQSRTGTDSVDAYHAYLKGRYCWKKRNDEDVKKSIEYFNRAIEADPNYALAYVGLADAYLVLGGFGIATLAPKEAYPKARAAAERALEIDDTLAEAHASLGYCLANYDWNWSRAEREFKRALDLKPGDPVAHHWYGFLYLASMGRLDQAIDELRHALELDPLSLSIGSNIGLLLYLARRYDDALNEFQHILEMDRSFVYTHWELALTYEQCGRYDEAIATFQKAIALSGPSTLPRTLLARAYALAGRKKEATALLDELGELSTQTYVSPYRIAAVYAALGDKDRAFKWLEHAYEGRDGWLIWLAVDPVVDSLRSDTRFADLLDRIGLASVGSQAKDFASSNGHALPASTAKRSLSVKSAVLIAGVMVVLFVLGYGLIEFLSDRETVSNPRTLNFEQVTYQSGPEFFPALSPDGKSIAYAGRASGNWDIYFQTIGNRSATNLTKDSVTDDSQPAFSPTGDRIAFRSERDGGGIYVMGANGGSPTRIADFGYSPSWSLDGGTILIGTEKIPQPSTRPTKSELWKIDVNTNQRVRISEGDALQPVFSPRQKRIAYWSRPDRYGQREHIWTVPANGGEAVAVTDGSFTDLNPVWSPDGKYLYFSSNRGGSSNIWRVAIDEVTGTTSGAPEAVTAMGATTSLAHLSCSRDGRLAYSAQTEIRNLRSVSFNPAQGTVGKPVSITQGSLQLWFPDASPDGEWLTAYSMGQQRHIFIMRTDGSEQRDLTPGEYRYAWPRWSPDGQRIAFSSRRTGDYELWIVNRDGSRLRQLTQSSGGHYSPWSADGSMIAYSIHAPKNDCVIMSPEKAWGDQKLLYLSPLSDASLSFEGWSWSNDGKKLAGIKHLPNGVHSGIGIYDLATKTYDWLTDFGDWPIWLNDNRHLLFVSQGNLLLFDTQTRKYRQLMVVSDQDVDIGSPAVSRDNRTIYFTYVAAEADIWIMQ